MTLAMRGHGVDKNLEGRFVVQAAGLLEREYPLHPATAFFGVAPETTFAPEHRETDGPFREIVGWLYASLMEKDKEMLHFFVKQSDEFACIAFCIAV